jgi:hypothetical protein
MDPQDSNVASFEHHFQTYWANAAAGTYYIRDGYWRRNSSIGKYTNVGTHDPLTDNIIPENFTGDIYNYVIRTRSSATSDPLSIIISGNQLPPDNQFKMEELVSVVSFNNGVGTTISQNLIGSIDDRIEIDDGNFDNFGIAVTKSDPYTVGFKIGGGELRRRAKTFDVDGQEQAVTSIQTQKVYINLDGTEGSPETDPSLIPYEPIIVIDTDFADYSTYDSDFVKLYEITKEDTNLDAAGGSSGLSYASISATKFHVGSINDDWVRPDGVDSAYITIADALPKVQGLDFVEKEGSYHRGELQDRQCLETLTADQPFLDYDKVLMFYEVNKNDVTIKQYVWVDGNGRDAGHNTSAGSLKIHDNYMEIWGFYAGASILIDNIDNLASYLLLARDSTAPNDANAKMVYLNLSDLTIDLDVVTNVSFDSDTGELIQTKRTIKILDYTDEWDETITTAEPCESE